MYANLSTQEKSITLKDVSSVVQKCSDKVSVLRYFPLLVLCTLTV